MATLAQQGALLEGRWESHLELRRPPTWGALRTLISRKGLIVYCAGLRGGEGRDER